MSDKIVKQDKSLKNILIGAAALATLYAAFQYFVNNKSTNAKTISLQLTQKILKEIKYQICANCLSFAEGVNQKLKAKYPEKELEIYLRTQISKIYDSKEQLILTKYQLPKQQYGASLKKYSKNKEINQGERQIFDMLQRAIKGQYPDLTVKPQAKNLYNPKQTLRVYYEMCEQIATKVWLKLEENIKQNPNFNSKDDLHFKKAIRQLSIYEFKAQYLEKKGFKKQWGCPNMTFFKVIESLKLGSPEVKKEASFIEKSYEILIAKISSDPQLYNRRQINFQMQQNFEKLKNPEQFNKPQFELMKKPSVSIPVESKKSQMISSIRKPVQQINKIEQQQFDLQKMMMNELLSRSQQQPVEQKRVEVPEPAPKAQIQVLKQQPAAAIQIPEEKKEEIIVIVDNQRSFQLQKAVQQESQLLSQIEQRQQNEKEEKIVSNQPQSLLISNEPEQIQSNIQQIPAQIQNQEQNQDFVEVPKGQAEVNDVQVNVELPQVFEQAPQQIKQQLPEVPQQVQQVIPQAQSQVIVQTRSKVQQQNLNVQKVEQKPAQDASNEQVRNEQ